MSRSDIILMVINNCASNIEVSNTRITCYTVICTKSWALDHFSSLIKEGMKHSKPELQTVICHMVASLLSESLQMYG